MKKTAIAALLLAMTTAPGICASYNEVNAGISYLNQDQHDEAIVWFSKALAAGDLSADLKHLAHLDRGMAYFAKKDMPLALADYAAAIAIKPDSIIAHRARISVYAALNENEKVLDEYAALLKIRPRDIETLFDLGQFSWRMDRADIAAKAFEPYSKQILYFWLWQQLAHVRLGMPVSDYNQAIVLDQWPGLLVRFYRGTMTETETLNAAKDAQSRNVKPSPDAACDSLFYVGMMRVARGDRAGARPLLQKLTDICKAALYLGVARSELAKANSEQRAK